MDVTCAAVAPTCVGVLIQLWKYERCLQVLPSSRTSRCEPRTPRLPEPRRRPLDPACARSLHAGTGVRRWVVGRSGPSVGATT
eukprot:3935241-Rhodomonas_salina.1